VVQFVVAYPPPGAFCKNTRARMGLNEARVIQKVVTHPIGGSADRIVRVPKGTRGHVAGYQKTEYWILILLWHQNLLFPSGTRRILSGLPIHQRLYQIAGGGSADSIVRVPIGTRGRVKKCSNLGKPKKWSVSFYLRIFNPSFFPKLTYYRGTNSFSAGACTCELFEN